MKMGLGYANEGSELVKGVLNLLYSGFKVQ